MQLATAHGSQWRMAQGLAVKHKPQCTLSAEQLLADASWCICCRSRLGAMRLQGEQRDSSESASGLYQWVTRPPGPPFQRCAISVMKSCAHSAFQAHGALLQACYACPKAAQQAEAVSPLGMEQEWNRSCRQVSGSNLHGATTACQKERLQPNTWQSALTPRGTSTCHAPMEVLVGAQGPLPRDGSPMQPGFWYCVGPAHVQPLVPQCKLSKQQAARSPRGHQARVEEDSSSGAGDEPS